MSKYINADATILRVAEQISYEIEIETGNAIDCVDLAEELLNGLPSIDIVQCYECRWENTQKCPPHRMGLIHDESDYCSYGIRKGADNEIS